MGSPGKEGGQGEVLQLRDASACQCEGEECQGPEGFQGEQKSKSGVLSYVEAEGAVGGEKNDQGGKFCFLLGNDGEAHTQPVIQVHDGCLEDLDFHATFCNSMAHELKLLFLWDPIVNTHLHMYCSD